MNVLNVNPGLIVWTLLNFGVFFTLLFWFGWKPLKASLQEREDSINNAIANAENANKEAMKIMKENQEKLAGAQQEVMNIVKDGRVQAEKIVAKATEEAEFIKNQKLSETEREMTRMKEEAFAQLRAEVATLVMNATEKILDQKLDAASHKQLIDSAIAQVSKN